MIRGAGKRSSPLRLEREPRGSVRSSLNRAGATGSYRRRSVVDHLLVAGMFLLMSTDTGHPSSEADAVPAEDRRKANATEHEQAPGGAGRTRSVAAMPFALRCAR